MHKLGHAKIRPCLKTLTCTPWYIPKSIYMHLNCEYYCSLLLQTLSKVGHYAQKQKTNFFSRLTKSLNVPTPQMWLVPRGGQDSDVGETILGCGYVSLSSVLGANHSPVSSAQVRFERIWAISRDGPPESKYLNY